MFPYTDTVVSKLVPGRTLVAALEAGVSRIPAHEGCFPTGVGHTIPVRPGEAPLLANRVAGACEWQEAGYGGHVHSCNACLHRAWQGTPMRVLYR